jgi:hypothetical protein
LSIDGRYLKAAATVAGHRVYEELLRPRCTDASEVPWSVSAVTPAWLTAVLCREHPDARVLAFREESKTSGTHDRARLVITYNEAGETAGLPKAVFTKSLPTLFTRMLVGHMGHSRFEMLFYKQIRPKLDIETPSCFTSLSDRRSLAAIHVLEDVAHTKHATFANHSTVVTKELANGMVDLLAELHGSHLTRDGASPPFGWVVDYHTWFTMGVKRVHTDRYLERALDRTSDILPSYIQDRRRHLWPAVELGVRVHRTEPRYLLHNDVHIGNWYITGDQRMGLLDWQCLVRGHWSRDVSYAIASALRIADRREWEVELLQRYLKRLEERSGVVVDFDSAWRDYRQQMLHALTNWTQTLCHPRLMPDSHPPELTLTMLERMYAAIADHHSIDIS